MSRSYESGFYLILFILNHQDQDQFLPPVALRLASLSLLLHFIFLPPIDMWLVP